MHRMTTVPLRLEKEYKMIAPEINRITKRLEASLEDVLERLEDLDIVKFYLPEFENDPSYEGLMQSLKNGDLQSAFRAAHTLKGIGYNLGLNRLGDRAAALCEVLHTGSVPAPELLRQLTEEYCCVIDAIHELKSEI